MSKSILFRCRLICPVLLQIYRRVVKGPLLSVSQQFTTTEVCDIRLGDSTVYDLKRHIVILYYDIRDLITYCTRLAICVFCRSVCDAHRYNIIKLHDISGGDTLPKITCFLLGLNVNIYLITNNVWLTEHCDMTACHNVPIKCACKTALRNSVNASVLIFIASPFAGMTRLIFHQMFRVLKRWWIA